MDLQLGNRTALVTGTSRGLGRAIVFKLAGEGVKTAIVARRGELLRELTHAVVPGMIANSLGAHHERTDSAHVPDRREPPRFRRA